MDASRYNALGEPFCDDEPDSVELLASMERREAMSSGWPVGVSPAEALVLDQLVDYPLPAHAIAQRLGSTVRAVRRLLKALDEKGAIFMLRPRGKPCWYELSESTQVYRSLWKQRRDLR